MKDKYFSAVSLSFQFVDIIDEYVTNSRGKYLSRAEFVRDAVREKIERIDILKGKQ